MASSACAAHIATHAYQTKVSTRDYTCVTLRVTDPRSVNGTPIAHVEKSFPSSEKQGESCYAAEVDERPEEDEVACMPDSVTDRVRVRDECVEMFTENQIQRDSEQEGEREMGTLSIRYAAPHASRSRVFCCRRENRNV